MWARGTTRKEHWLLPIGVMVLVVWLGFYAWETLLYARVLPYPQNASALVESVTVIPVVAVTAMILLVGLTIQLARKGPRLLFVAFVILEVVSLALVLGATAYFLTSFPTFSIATNYMVYTALYLASAVSSAVAAFLVLLLALPARRAVPLQTSTVPVTPSPPTP